MSVQYVKARSGNLHTRCEHTRTLNDQLIRTKGRVIRHTETRSWVKTDDLR